jgi:hypothetical protein
MTAPGAREPLVAVLYSVPLLYEAISSSLDEIAEVHGFPARRGDPVGLLRALAPDAVVVDDPAEAEAVSGWAEEQDVPLVHVRLVERKLRLLRHGEWQESIGASADAIRNVIAGSLYARDPVRS